MNISREKLNFLKNSGRNPFLINKFEVNSNSRDLIEKLDKFSREELKEKLYKVSIAGRIMRIRNFGGLSFFVLRDYFGDIQLLLNKNINFLELEIGDIIGVSGLVIKTQKKQLTVEVESFNLLSKCLKSIPDFYYGFNDLEERFRNRHVDFIVNNDNKKIIFNRSRMIKNIRNFLDKKGFIEIETPILVSEASGAQAKPFTTYHNKLNRNLQLRIATEIPLKTLLIGGFEKVYEIGKVFRNEGIDARHNPEFTTIEIYESYQNSEHMMLITEQIFNSIRNEVFDNKEIFYFNGNLVNIGNKFRRISMIDSIKDFTGVDFNTISDFNSAKNLAKKFNIELDGYQNSVGHIVTIFFENFVEEKLIQPTFIYNYPIETSPLAKSILGNERFADRFELFISGLEFANGYSELNDADEQRSRFEMQASEKNLGNDEIASFDNEFVEALEYGMPPAGGLGIGIDRLAMLFNEKNNIREVIAFPQMKKR